MKCKQHFLVVCSLMFICFAGCAPPPELKKCKSDDDKCMTDVAKAMIPRFAKGFPDVGVPSLDPLQMKLINASEGNLIFVLSDITATGLSKCEPKKISRDKAKSKMHLSFLCTGHLEGQYEIKGNILVVPIEGSGPIHADLRSCLLNLDADLVDKIGEDGKKHWQIKTWSYTFDFKDKSDVVFENLYNGNEVLGRAARELVKDHGNEIIKEIGPPVMKAMITKVLKAVNGIFKAYAVEDLSLDD